MKFITIEEILKQIDREYCTCNDNHGFFNHDDDMDDMWCKECTSKCTREQINWGVRRIRNTIMQSRIVLEGKVKSYHGKLYEHIDINLSYEQGRLIWK